MNFDKKNAKLGKNPFEKKPKRPLRKAQQKPQKAFHEKHEEPPQVTWRKITHEWVPQARACAYIRILKFVSRFA